MTTTTDRAQGPQGKADMSAAPTTATVAKKRAVPENRMLPVAFVHGEPMHLCLPGDERIEPGPQDVDYLANIGGKLAMHQQIEVTNDAGSFWRLMRVERVHGSPGSGLRALTLRDVVPPYFSDMADEPVVSIGQWYVRFGGAHRKWMVVTPAGAVRREGINSESEARHICRLEESNPRA